MPENIKLLYQRFLNKSCSKAELQILFDYFDTVDETLLKALIMSELENEQIEMEHDQYRVQKLQQLYAEISGRINVVDEEQKVIKIRTWRIAVAVAAAIFLAIGYVLFTQPKAIELKTVYAAYGKRLEIVLPDSSLVSLNAGSTLQYPVTFGGNSRTITLKEGEAFFQVKHHANKPFVVHTRGTNINVLGTSFEISAFEKEKNIKVTVSLGKVGILQPSINKTATYLLPGDRATINNKTHNIQKSKVDIDDVAAWRNDRLIFEDQPIDEVMRSLERTYNVHIRIDNQKLLHERVSMRLNHQPLNNVLTAISFSNHLTFSKDKNQLISVN